MAKRIYDYEGNKKITSIRLSDLEKKEVKKAGFKSVQEFVQVCLNNIQELRKLKTKEGVYIPQPDLKE